MQVIGLVVCWLFGLWFATTQAGEAIGLVGSIVAASLSLLLALLLRSRDARASHLLACLMMFAWGVARMWLVQEQRCLLPHVCAFNDAPRAAELTGHIVADPEVQDRSVTLRIAVDSITYRTTEHPDGITEAVEGDILVRTLRYPVIDYGSEVVIAGKLETPFESAEFSYKDMLALEGIYSSMFLPRIDVIAEGQGNPLLATLYDFKQDVADTLGRTITAPESGLLKAVLLGDKSDMPDALQDDFRTAGLSHLIAISGFHVLILMMTVLRIADAFVKPQRAMAITFGVLLLYAVMVGLRPSVLRAVLMGMAYLLAARVLGRRNATVGVLALVAFLMTAWNPQWLWNVGFQLSFAATLGIALFAFPLERWLRTKALAFVSMDWVEGGFGRILSIIAVTTAAQITTLPLVAWHFEEISLISLLSNLIVVPVQPLVMLFGAASGLLGLAVEPLGQLVGWVAWLFLTFTIQSVELLARVPYASLPIRVSTYSLVFFYAVIGLVGWYALQGATAQAAMRERLSVDLSQRTATALSGMAALFVLTWSGSQPDGKLHVTFFDVGQGDATLIQTPTGRQILIDAGYFPSIINAHLGRTIPFWDREIDMVIATHPDADHVTGLPEVFERYRVGQFVYDGNLEGTSTLYDAVLERVAQFDVPSRPALAGETIVIEDGVRLEVVHPGRDLDDEIRNNNSVSLRLVYGDFSLLLSGDAERAAEREMVERGVNLASVVYKVGHHGSDTSSTQRFLDEVRPKIAVISVGEDNRFGHPHPDVIARLQAMGAAILTTSELGTIEVTTDGEQMWWTARD